MRYPQHRTNWGFRTSAQPGLDGRAIFYPRGKVLGGSGSINGMIAMRGQAEDFDALVIPGGFAMVQCVAESRTVHGLRWQVLGGPKRTVGALVHVEAQLPCVHSSQRAAHESVRDFLRKISEGA